MKSILGLGLFLAGALCSPLAPSQVESEATLASASKFTFYDLPSPVTGPCDLCKGPDGAIWGSAQFAPTIFRVDPSSGKVETFPIPFTLAPFSNVTLPSAAGRTALACAIRPGADGNLYAAFGTRNQFVRIDPKTKKITVFGPPELEQPAGNLQPFNDLYSAKDGVYFTQTTDNKLSFFSFATQRITNYEVPTPQSGPLGVYVASDGKVYFTEFAAQKFAVFDPATRRFREFPVPLPALAGPAVVRAETAGSLWFTAFVANAIGRFDPRTGAMRAYANPSAGTFATEDTVDSRGDIWFSTATQNLLNRLEPATGAVSAVTMPGTAVVGPASVPLYYTVAINYGPGDAIWFTEGIPNRVGRYALS